MSVRHIFASVLLCSGAAALVAGCSSESDGGSPNTGGSGAQTAGTGAGVGGSGTSGAAGTAAGGTGVVPQGGSGTTAGAGGTGTAGTGTGGTNATAGAGGTGTAGAGGGGGGPYTVPRGKSMGCGKQNDVNEPGKFTKHDIEVTGVDPYWGTVKMPYVGNGNPGNYTFTHRNYFVRLPSNYDPNKAYPLVFGGGGCGGDTVNGNGGGRDMLSNDTRNDAISIGLSYFWPDGAGACFGDEYENTYEIPYWESVYQEVTKDLCVDLEKVFIAGYSSGAWMAYTTALAKGGKVRGMGAGAGGIREKHPPRANIPFAAMLITGKDDGGNPVHKTKDKTTCNGTEAEGCWLGKIICGFPGAEDCYDTGSANGRDEILKLNGCVGTATQQYDRFPDCQQYTGCPAAFPVVYCLVEGGHTEGGDRFNPGIWEFWSKLPAVP